MIISHLSVRTNEREVEREVEMNIMKCFPDGMKPRKAQEKALIEVEKAIKAGFKDIVILGPTGSGKSIIGKTIMNYINREESGKCYYITPSKILQDQYAKDFPELPILKGKSSYFCCDPFQQGKTVDKASCSVKNESCDYGRTPADGSEIECPYYRDLDRVALAPQSILNYHVLFFHLLKTRKLKTRTAVLVDEAHNLEAILHDFCKATFNQTDFPESIDFSWDNENIVEELREYMNDILIYLEDRPNPTDKEIKQANDYRAKIYALDHLKDVAPQEMVKYEEFDKKRNKVLVVEQIHIGEFIQHFLQNCGLIRIYMSATINFQEFCFAANIDPATSKYIELKSEFPPENAPIARMFDTFAPRQYNMINYKNQHELVPIAAKGLVEIQNMFPNQRILVHTHSRKMEELICENISDHSRILLASEFPNRMEAINAFKESRNKMMLSYSLYEGIDLPDDICRIIVFMKVPFIPLVNPYIVARREYVIPGMVNRFYEWQTAKTIIQGVARHIRNKDDYGLVFFMDNVDNFIRYNGDLFPKEVMERFKVDMDGIREVIKKVKGS